MGLFQRNVSWLILGTIILKCQIYCIFCNWYNLKIKALCSHSFATGLVTTEMGRKKIEEKLERILLKKLRLDGAEVLVKWTKKKQYINLFSTRLLKVT